MTIAELLLSLLIFIGFATLRFGLPILMIWLFKQFCDRVLYFRDALA